MTDGPHSTSGAAAQPPSPQPDDHMVVPPRAAGAGARRSTLVVMAATLLTKVVGLAREVVVAALFGVTATMSAFTVAFQIPNVIRTFVADQALVSSIVPVFTDLRERGEEERAWRVAGTIVSVLILLLLPLTALSMYGAEFLVDLAVHDRFSQMDLAVSLFRIMIPVVVLMSLGGVIIGILNSYGSFGPPAFAQLAFNGVAVVALVVGVAFADGDVERIQTYAWAVTGATLVQALLPAPWLRGHGRRLGLAGAFGDPAVRAIMIAMLPVMLSLAMLNLNNIVNTYWSSRVPDELLLGVADAGPAVIDKAFRIFQLPQGIFSLAVATVFFPMFARHSARGDNVAFRDAGAAGMRQIIVLLMPASTFLFFLAEPVVRLLYEHSRFTADSTELVAAALQGFAVGLIGNGGIQLFMRAFFSLRTPWTPAIIGFLVNFLGNILLGGLLHERYGVRGITVSMALANLASFAVMWLVLRRRLGGMPTRPLVTAVAITLPTALVATGAGWLSWRLVDELLGRSTPGQLTSMLAAIAVTYGLYGAVAVRLNLINLRTLRGSLRRS